MKNYEYLQKHSAEDIAYFLCEAMEYLSKEEYYPCDRCPMRERCSYGENGWLNWLMEAKK
jgi:hypothetical protein